MDVREVEASHNCLPSDLLKVLSRDYAIEPRLIRSASAIHAGPASQAWMVELSSDSGHEQKFCIKKHRSSERDRISFELKLGHLMRQVGFDLIPNLVLTRDNRLLAQSEDLSLISISEFVDCKDHFHWTEGRWSFEQCRAAGAALAQFHSATLRLLQQDSSLRREELLQIAPSLAPTMLGAVQETCSNLERFVQSASMPAKQSLVSALPLTLLDSAQHGKPLLAAFELAYQQTFGGSPVPELLLHGDYHPANVLFSDARVMAVVDLDYVQLGPALYDIGYGALLFSLRMQKTDAGSGLDDGKLDAFIAGYNEQAFSSAGVSPIGSLLTRQELLPWVRLSALVVGAWFLDLFMSQPEERDSIATPMLRTLEWALAVP